MSDWQELDDLTAELRANNAAWAERVDALAAEGEPLGRLTADVERQFAELGVREALEALAQRALAGAATIYEARRPFGYARSATLAWHPGDDPRAELASEQREALVTIEVSIGPRLLLGAGEGVPADDRLAVLILGEKRVMATLPTSREKFRGALLRAFAAPRRAADTHESDATPAEAGGEAEAAQRRQAEPGANEAAGQFAEGVAADRAGEMHGAEPYATPVADEAANAKEASGSAPARSSEPEAAQESSEPISEEDRAQADESAAAAESEKEERPFKNLSH